LKLLKQQREENQLNNKKERKLRKLKPDYVNQSYLKTILYDYFQIKYLNNIKSIL
jgi:hypothetical protein